MVDIRRAEKGDVPGIKDVLAITWRDTYSIFCSIPSRYLDSKESPPVNDQLNYYLNKLGYEIDSWDLNVAREAGENITVVDTRSPEAFQREHIVGAINIPHRTMSPETTRHIDKKSLIVTCCDGIGCNGSTKGAVNMLKLGFQVKELIGGLDWWKRDGHKTHTATTSDKSVSCGCA